MNKFEPAAPTIERRKQQLEQNVIPSFGRGSNGGKCPLPNGARWVPHIGKAQRYRVLRQTWNKFEKICKKNTFYNDTALRLLDWVEQVEKEVPEYLAMSIVHIAKLSSDAQFTDWAEEIDESLEALKKGVVNNDSNV